MKKVLAVVLALALTLSLVGMAMAEGKVGVAMPTQSLQRWNQDGTNMNTEKRLFKGKLKQYSLLIALVIIIAFFQIVTGGLLLKPMNVSNVVFQNAYVVILAIGMLLCILTGGNIDLSVGSVVALVSAAAGQMIIVWKWNVYFSIGICLLLGIMRRHSSSVVSCICRVSDWPALLISASICRKSASTRATAPSTCALLHTSA